MKHVKKREKTSFLHIIEGGGAATSMLILISKFLKNLKLQNLKFFFKNGAKRAECFGALCG